MARPAGSLGGLPRAPPPRAGHDAAHRAGINTRAPSVRRARRYERRLLGEEDRITSRAAGEDGMGRVVTVRELMHVPDLYDTIERWQEFTGRDLTRYTRAGLLVERDRLRWVLLALDDRPAARNERRL